MAPRRFDSTRRVLIAALLSSAAWLALASRALAQPPPVPPPERGRIEAERMGSHGASSIRTMYWNFGMVGDFPPDPFGVDLSVFHSLEVPKGSGMNYSDGFTPFVLAKIRRNDGTDAYIMETGYRERQALSPHTNRVMRFEPRPGYFQPDPGINVGRAPAISSDPRTWPPLWADKRNDPDDPGWSGSWNGYFGKHPAADEESFFVMDDDFYDAWDFYPDSRDPSRRGLGLRIEVRGFQWADPQAGKVMFWHYEVTNEGTTDYDNNILVGFYMDTGIGSSMLSCDGVFESDDDDAYFDRSLGSDLVYTWDHYGHGVDLSGLCAPTGYLAYAYLETPGNALNGVDDDADGVVDEQRDGGPGTRIVGQSPILAYWAARYDTTKFTATYGPLVDRPAYRAGSWWTGDEDMDWRADLDDRGADGVPGTHDSGEGDGIPTAGEVNFDRTDVSESDQIGLAGFKINRIRAGAGNPDPTTDNIVFYDDGRQWPARLYGKFTSPNPADRFDPPLTANYNLGFLLASGPFLLKPGKSERFSLALAYGADLTELGGAVHTVQKIYKDNYQFGTSPPPPVAMAFDFTPGTLNLASHGRWVTGTLEPAVPFAAGDIDIASIRLNDTVPVDPEAPTAFGDHDTNGVPDLTVKFDRTAVELAIPEGDRVPVHVTGTVGGHDFAGTDTIHVRRAVVSAPPAGSRLIAGSATEVRWRTTRSRTAQSVALHFSPDGGTTWSLIAKEQPNNGSYAWTVPNLPTDQAKVAVVLAESADGMGDLVDRVLGVSDAFSIDTVVGVGTHGAEGLALAIRGAVPNPSASGRLFVEFALRDGSPATLELADVAGRVVTSRQVGTLGPGKHSLDFSAGVTLRPGIYFLRLTQGGSEARARAAVIQ